MRSWSGLDGDLQRFSALRAVHPSRQRRAEALLPQVQQQLVTLADGQLGELADVGTGDGGCQQQQRASRRWLSATLLPDAEQVRLGQGGRHGHLTRVGR